MTASHRKPHGSNGHHTADHDGLGHRHDNGRDHHRPVCDTAATKRASSARPVRCEPDYGLPQHLPLTPTPIPAVAIFFASSAIQLLLMMHAAHGVPLSAHPRLVALACCLQAVYLITAFVSVRSAQLVVMLSPLTFLPTLFFPPTFPFFTFICTIAQCVYFLHILAFHRAFAPPSAFAQWNGWTRAIFILSYIDMRDCRPIPELVALKKDPTSSRSVWSVLWPRMKPHIVQCAILNLVMIASGYAVVHLQSKPFFDTLEQSWTEGDALPLLLLWTRYISIFLMTTFCLGFVDHFYALVFLLLGLESLPSQNSPLLATSLNSFWSGRWNLTIHSLLYHFFYLPLRRRKLKNTAILAAFSASAALHTYPALVAGMSLGNAACIIAFFLCHAILMMAEKRLNVYDGWAGRCYVYASMLMTLPLLCEPFISLTCAPH